MKHQYRDATTWQAGQWGPMSWETPAREASFEGDVAVPFLQSVISGLVIGAPIGGALAIWRGWPVWTVGAALALVLALTWCWRLRAHTRLLWLTEHGAPVEAPAPAKPQEMRVEVTERNAHGMVGSMRYLDVPGVEAAQLSTFARAVTEGDGLGVNAWTGSTGLFTRGQYDGLMGQLERAGLVEHGSGNRGRQLTAAGRAVLSKMGAG